MRKLKENLFWASIYNGLAIPVVAGVLQPTLGIAPRPAVSAPLMSLSSIIVASNAVSVKRWERGRPETATAGPPQLHPA